jgi:hypothetical protein
VWLILIMKCVVLLIVDAFWLILIRKCVVDTSLADFDYEMCSTSNSGRILAHFD